MRRREFIAGVGSATAWPLVALAQQPAMPVIGWLSSRSQSASVEAAFRRALKETGYVEGQNVHIAFRWAEGHYDRLPALATNLVDGRVTVIVAVAGDIVPRAAKAATSTIPIVFLIGEDPVKVGIVDSLNRPGANVTGVTLFTQALVAKRLELLARLVPAAELVAVLVNRSFPPADALMADVEAAARQIGQKILYLNAAGERDFDPAFASMVQRRAGALMVMPDAFLNTQRDLIISLAGQFAVPIIYDSREHVVAGGLMSYGTSYIDTYRQLGVYTGRILRGEKPADLPVLLLTKFEFVMNLKAAKALGIEIPPMLLALTDEVIE
jgi:putative ABC transport system substrate-binding protein